MFRSSTWSRSFAALLLAALLLAGCAGSSSMQENGAAAQAEATAEARPLDWIEGGAAYPPTKKVPAERSYHGITLVDNFMWLEDGDAPEVEEWVRAQEELTHAYLDDLPQIPWLEQRFEELWRYDDETVPWPVKRGERLFWSEKKAEQEKWVRMTKAGPEAEPEVVLDPNQWPAEETLAGFSPSFDGRFVAYGVARGGDENPRIRILDLEQDELLPDTLRGWRQHVTAWLPDNSGFYYMAQPLPGEVPEGEEFYWYRVYFHSLGSPGSSDPVVWSHDEVKEYWHSVSINSAGEWLLLSRSLFYANDLYVLPVGAPFEERVAVAEGMEAEYHGLVVGDRLIVRTDEEAPRYRAFIVDAADPARENWEEFIPQSNDLLQSITPADGRLYATFLHNAYTVIKVYDLEGNELREVELPTLGTASVSGRWELDDVRISFSSYAYPSTTFRYHYEEDSLEVIDEFPVEVDVSGVTARQVWYESMDGTPVSMFIVHDKDMVRNGNHPTILSGYGGFNVSLKPYFSTTWATFIEAGGIYAVANLRGGGEYGQEWHEAGMKGDKQNVFEDFIAAGEYLVANGYTRSDRLAISGGSNGGLLVGAAMVQRPALWKAVLCQVPLLDMVNYHRFGLANIWAEEYGSSEDPEAFAWLRAYSPYHNVREGVDYPAALIVGSENDARVDPLHARKMVARLQEANPDGEPHLLLHREASGHGGGTTLTVKIRQSAETLAFLMAQIGLQAPGTQEENGL